MEKEKLITLAGNPNVGKSTVFNGLTGMNQHTGNWSGKTVSTAKGVFKTANKIYTLIDTPGTYSLFARSKEEEVARDYICFGESDTVLVVCDATALERNLNLVLQIIETGKKTIVCVNLMDEARRRGIKINLKKLSALLGCPVIGVVAHKKHSLKTIGEALDEADSISSDFKLPLPAPIDKALDELSLFVPASLRSLLSPRWIALKFLTEETAFTEKLAVDSIFSERLKEKKAALTLAGFTPEILSEKIAEFQMNTASSIYSQCVTYEKSVYDKRSRKLDKLFTGKYTAFPFMILLFAIILFLTVSGANLPSEALSHFLFWIEEKFNQLLVNAGAPEILRGILVDGAYRTTAWVVSVMLPPMAIFFPLFTLLEDSGYLPRVAYNLDKPFQKCSSCGKQALTMCMGLGCNAAAISGCRIIDSKRERILAILTNSFIPCNGRFPIIITMLSVFLVPLSLSGKNSFLSSIGLLAVLILSVVVSFIVTKILSKTILKGLPSSFVLELPPYRKPRIASVLIRSLLDRTLFVLGRAVSVALPAGVIIYLLANLKIGSESLLVYFSDALDPIGKIMGLDGVILAAFILGFPAGEIVLPIALMIYLSNGVMPQIEDISSIGLILKDNGWTALTGLNFMLFTLMHWPCSTTLLTIKKETGSWRWTVSSAIIPTAIGFLFCVATTLISKIFT